MRNAIAFFLAALACQFPAPLCAKAVLDLSFGDRGRVFTNFKLRANNGSIVETPSDRIAGIAIQPDGAIAAAGISDAWMSLTRYNPDGSPDASFAQGSYRKSDFTWASGLALQADGRILAFGASQEMPMRNYPLPYRTLLRVDSHGGLDASFGVGGWSTEGESIAAAALILDDGRIVVAGHAVNRVLTPESPYGGVSIYRFLVRRLLPDGRVDTTFTGGGIATALGTPSYANALAVRADGSIVVAGTAGSNMAVLAYSPEGTPSTSLVSNALDQVTALVQQADGKILVAGASAGAVAVVRLHGNATSFDTTFAAAGRFVGDPGLIVSIALQPDGRILALTSDWRLFRLDEAGQLDAAFAESGILSIDMGAGAMASSLALQRDGRILVGGSGFARADADFALARVDPEGPVVVTTSTSLLDFGGQSINTTAPPLELHVANTSPASMSVLSVGIAPPFALSHDCAELAPGARCAVTVTFTPAAQGPVESALTIETGAGTASVRVTGSGERSLATHYYRSILRRAPDAGGKAYWESEAARLQSLGAKASEAWFAMAMSFYSSAEYRAFGRNPTEYVRDLYNTFYNRPADDEGLAYWTGRMASGMPPEGVLASFIFSAEFAAFSRALFGDAASRAEVDTVVDFYRGLLSRMPDTGGFLGWLAQFRAAQCAGGADAVYAVVESVSAAFTASAEYAARGRTDEQYVADLYNAFLRRGADLDGIRYWIGQVASGASSREAVRRQFLASPEFGARVAEIVLQGCWAARSAGSPSLPT